MSATKFFFLLGEIKTIAGDYLQNLKIMRSLTYSEKQQSNCSKFFLIKRSILQTVEICISFAPNLFPIDFLCEGNNRRACVSQFG